tara:strand:+ start:99 stop:278 length:180 start_codon:yes stop_codon:yes gene_type:complete
MEIGESRTAQEVQHSRTLLHHALGSTVAAALISERISMEYIILTRKKSRDAGKIPITPL